ncbi:hypothetical protein BD413DRAFT_167003 [Trametes elegans]|nr:hypothetical protein BD413DRAFT_167003 [Trametes elegans]
MHRASNLSMQRLLGSWPLLENHQGIIGLLYFIGIPCHVRVLDLTDSAGWLGCTYGPRVLDAVLECARPHLLRLSMWDGSWFGTSHFLETFSRQNCVGALEFLRFELDLFRKDPASRQ